MNMRSFKCCSAPSDTAQSVKDLSSFLKLISDNSRLQLLSILQKGEHCVCELIGHTHLSQSLISHHLTDLKKAKLVLDRKEGKWSYYSLTSKGTDITNSIFKIKI